MNDMSRIWRIPTPPPDRSVREAITRGFFGRCPACGRGRLFRSYLKVVNACNICGEAFTGHRADDAPAYLTLLIVAHVVGAGILLSDETVAAFLASLGRGLLARGDACGEPPHSAARQGRDRRPAMGDLHAWFRGRPRLTEAGPPARALRPRDAATLILVDRSPRGAALVLMGKRHDRHRFMPGKYRLSRRPGRARGPAHGRGRRARSRGRGEAQRARAPALARLRAGGGARRHSRDIRGDRARHRRPRPRRARKIRRPAPGPASPRPASIPRSTPSTCSPARSPRPGACGGSTRAFSLSTRASSPGRVDGAVHAEAELVELVWTPLDEARRARSARHNPRRARRPRAGARRRPRQGPAPPVLSRGQGKAAARAALGALPAPLTRQAARATGGLRAPSGRDDRPSRCGASSCSAPSPRRGVRS